MQITELSLKDITPYAKNPRHNENAVEKVAESIKNFGFQQPIVVDADNIIIIGHTRYLAAKQLNLKTVPVVIAKDLTPEKVKTLRITDNKVAQFSTWDDGLLKLELEALKEMDVDLKDTGFDMSEIEYLFKEPDFSPVEENDEDRLDKKTKAMCPSCGHVFEP